MHDAHAGLPWRPAYASEGRPSDELNHATIGRRLDSNTFDREEKREVTLGDDAAMSLLLFMKR